jgi:hypothetical protein
MWGYYHGMLRLVFATVLMAACHPAPAPTVVHAAPIAAAQPAPTSRVRQDFEMSDAIQPGPLHEVLATGHECRQTPIAQPTGPIEPIQPIDRPLQITVESAACQPFVNGHRRLSDHY